VVKPFTGEPPPKERSGARAHPAWRRAGPHQRQGNPLRTGPPGLEMALGSAPHHEHTRKFDIRVKVLGGAPRPGRRHPHGIARASLSTTLIQARFKKAGL